MNQKSIRDMLDNAENLITEGIDQIAQSEKKLHAIIEEQKIKIENLIEDNRAYKKNCDYMFNRLRELEGSTDD